MDPATIALLVVAAVFALVNGANDGSALVATGLKIPSVRPLSAIVLLCLAIAVVPLVVGTRVATTLADRLVGFTGPGGQPALAIAVLAAIGVVVLLAGRGLPTSLTLAIVGGITGAGLGWGLPVAWDVVGLVVALGAAAPIVGAAAAFVVVRLADRVPVVPHAGPGLRRSHRIAYALQCVAYAANDGQKMIAVFAVAGGAAGQVEASPPQLAAIAALFGLGLLLGIRRVAGTLTGGVLAVRPRHAVSAELAAAGAVLGSAALGAPVSMTQAVASALVGAGVSDTYHKVRWAAASRIVLAWVLTLPTAVAVAAVTARIARLLV